MFGKVLSKTVAGSLASAGILFCLSNVDAAMAYDRHIVLQNNSGEAIVEFHASNVGTHFWQEDILGSDILLPGSAARIDLDDGTGYCRFDFKTVMENGQEIVRHNVDVCALERYTVG
jgi:hypothetical protein